MLNRRTFLQFLAGLTSTIMISPTIAQTPATAPAPDKDALGPLLPRRKLGRTGLTVTMLGLGGAHVADQNERDAQATIETAIEGGVRYFDTAQNYRGSEVCYGRFLTPKYREHIFLATKTEAHDAEKARTHLNESLQKLKTDYVDLWQIHGVQTKADVDRRLSQGVLDVFLEAKEKGRVRHLGFSGHTHPETHKYLIELMAKRQDPLETCLLPINVIDPSYLSFIDAVLPELTKRNFGIVAMKSLGSGTFFQSHKFPKVGEPVRLVPDRLSVREAVYFTWSLPVSVMLSGPSKPEQFREMCQFAREFVALSESQRRTLVDRAADCAGTTLETYKAKT